MIGLVCLNNEVVNNFGPMLGVLPQLVWDEETKISNTSEDPPDSVKGVPELMVINEVKLKVLEQMIVGGAPHLKETTEISNKM